MATTKREETETVPAAPLTAEEAIAAAKKAPKRTVTTAQEKDERGFVFLPDKRKLVGRAFTIVDAEDGYEAMGDYWVTTVRLVIGDKALFIRDTSGTGIRAQIEKIGYEDIRGSHWPKGLRVSDYVVDGRPAATFYLDDTTI